MGSVALLAAVGLAANPQMTEKMTITKDDERAVFPPSISTLDAAKRLGVAVPTVQRWLDQGVLEGWKTPGGHRRIDVSSVQSFIDSRVDRLSPAPSALRDILLIEDDPIYVELLQEQFAEWMPGTRVRIAFDGFEGLAEVAAHIPTCVITDIRMPHMDGVQLIRHLLQRHPPLAGRVLVVSSGDGAELSALGPLRAAVTFFPKSARLEALCAAVERILRA